MRHLVLIAAGKRDDRGNVFKPSREKASGLPGSLPNVINNSTAFVHDGTPGAANTLRCILAGAGLPESQVEFQYFEKLTSEYPDGPTYTELAQSWRFLLDLDVPNVVVCVDLAYLRAFAQHILGRSLKFEVAEADAIVVTLGLDGRTPDTTSFVSPYVE